VIDRTATGHIQRLIRWLQPFQRCFGYRAQRLALRTYVHGLFSDSDRKSMQAMLARVTDAIAYQGFQHFHHARDMGRPPSLAASPRDPAGTPWRVDHRWDQTHKTQAVRSFLIAHPTVRLHFTPTYSSWLNQVELWFSKIQRDLLARGIFTSVNDLARRIRTYIHRYNKVAKPLRWSYRNPAHRISGTSADTVH
jgi:hypothetical protein